MGFALFDDKMLVQRFCINAYKTKNINNKRML